MGKTIWFESRGKRKQSGWRNESRRHSLARKGIKTAYGKIKAQNQNPDLKNWYYITFLDRIRAYDIEDFHEQMDDDGLIDGMGFEDWKEHSINERLMDYPDEVDWNEEGSGWIEVKGKIYFRATTKENAIDQASQYDFQSFDVHNAKSNIKIMDEVEIYDIKKASGKKKKRYKVTGLDSIRFDSKEDLDKRLEGFPPNAKVISAKRGWADIMWEDTFFAESDKDAIKIVDTQYESNALDLYEGDKHIEEWL